MQNNPGKRVNVSSLPEEAAGNTAGNMRFLSFTLIENEFVNKIQNDFRV